ncbi:hypothetical protein B0A50_06550 [Salinomyces thailandicus]|uniref:RRM domain-containing protein n=1 Tax=Salinomyces thailandicus TaxID=706561 RepID=A0A4U0TNX5_9PEZI|nr:hypothetical protein B0A50_06550 [Salinomyces thailandica]
MSQDAACAAVSRKDKKAQRDAERRKGGKKRKHAETVKVDDGTPRAEPEQDLVSPTTGEGDSALAVKAPKPKKRKARDDDVVEAGDATAGSDAAATTSSKPKKRKKQAQKQDTDGAAPEGTEIAEDGKARRDRFVVFIGNLPYNTTDTSLKTHFKSLEPFTLRHRIDPKTKKSKGFAFLEFENYDRMKTCLKLYHHSYFDPDDPGKASFGEGEAEAVNGRAAGRGRKEKGRRINVELTAGGGGKKDVRMEKIKAKNVKLEEQRRRRLEQERKEGARDERKGAAARKSRPPKDEVEKAVDAGGMHPSRLARLQG